VQANVRGRDIGSFVAEARERVAVELDLPPGYQLVWGGQFELQQEANARFAIVLRAVHKWFAPRPADETRSHPDSNLSPHLQPNPDRVP
jgi:hypothetical protein